MKDKYNNYNKKYKLIKKIKKIRNKIRMNYYIRNLKL